MRGLLRILVLLLLSNPCMAVEVEQIERLRGELELLKSEQQSLSQKMEHNQSGVERLEQELVRLSDGPETPPAKPTLGGPPTVSKKERLEKRVESLEEMTGKMFLLEPVEEIKKVSEWVCPEGHIYDHASLDGSCHLCGKPQEERVAYRKFKYARKESISDRIEAMMEEGFKKKVAVGLSATGIFQQLVNSRKKDTSFAEGSLDLLFFHRPMINSTLFVDLEAIG
ncbi:MAG: hypothetical protein AAB048_01830, partial [Planctomycetota bacterium]